MTHPQSQRAIGDLMGVSEATIGRDIGNRSTATFDAISPVETAEIATFDAPAIPADDYDAVKIEQHKQEKESTPRRTPA